MIIRNFFDYSRVVFSMQKDVKSLQIMSEKILKDLETIKKIQKIIFDINKENISHCAQKVMNMFIQDINEHQYSFKLIVCQMVYLSFIICNHDYETYFNFMKKFEMFDVFKCFILRKNTNESNYLIAKMIDDKYIDPKFLNEMKLNLKAKQYFAHYLGKEKSTQQKLNLSIEYYKELSKNDWKLHKQLIKEGVNPNEIAKIIRNDDIEKLQEISSPTKFDFNQTIEPSLYERCSFINKENVSLIAYASYFGSVKCFKYLLMNNARLVNVGKYAVAGGNLEIIHLCEQNHSTFEDVYEIAIEFHRNDIFKYLYEMKVPQNNLSELGKKCILYHNYEIFTFLQKGGMKIDESHIKKSASIGNIFLLKYIHIFNHLPENILIFSSRSGNFELVKYIFEQKEKININAKTVLGKTPLIIGSEKGHTEIVKLLLEQKDIDINAEDYDEETALISATKNGHPEIIELLLEQKDIDITAKDGIIILNHASKKGHIEIVKLLLERKEININAKDKKGETALMKASKNGQREIVKLLLEQKGIDVNVKTIFSGTALVLASENGYTDIVKLLLDHKEIDINSKDISGETSLMEASYFGYTEIVKLLLEHEGIDINAKDDLGKTALIYASEKGHKEIVKLLLEQKGIDINANTKGGYTARKFAYKNGHTEIVELLIKEKETKSNTEA